MRASLYFRRHFYFFHAHPQLNLNPCVAYFIRSCTNGWWNAALLGAICPLKFTENSSSTFGPLNSVSVLVFCTCQNGFSLQNSVYVSVLFIFVASVGICWSSYETLSTRYYGVLWGPCFCCSFSFPFLWLFGAWEPSFFLSRFPSIPGVSFIFGYWMPCSSAVWDPSWCADALFFGFLLPYLLFITSVLTFSFLFFHLVLQIVVGRVFLFLSSSRKTSPCILLRPSVFPFHYSHYFLPIFNGLCISSWLPQSQWF